MVDYCFKGMPRYILIIFLIVIFNTKSYSFELIMIDSKNCVYCKKFKNEVMQEFKIPNLPIVIIDQANQPNWFAKAIKQNIIKPFRGTPTFVIWNDVEKYEVDRIYGYVNKDTFYKQLKEIFVRFLNEKDLSS